MNIVAEDPVVLADGRELLMLSLGRAPLPVASVASQLLTQRVGSTSAVLDDMVPAMDMGRRVRDRRWLFRWWLIYGASTLVGYFLSGFFSSRPVEETRLAEAMTRVGLEWAPTFVVFTVIIGVWAYFFAKKDLSLEI